MRQNCHTTNKVGMEILNLRITNIIADGKVARSNQTLAYYIERVVSCSFNVTLIGIKMQYLISRVNINLCFGSRLFRKAVKPVMLNDPARFNGFQTFARRAEDYSYILSQARRLVKYFSRKKRCIASTIFTTMVAYATSFSRFKASKPMTNAAVILNLFPCARLIL